MACVNRWCNSVKLEAPCSSSENMPRKKTNAKGSASARDNRVVSTRSSSARSRPRRSSEDTPRSSRGTSSGVRRGDQEEPSRTTATRKRAGPPPSRWGKRQQRSERRSESGADLEAEDIDTPLTRGDIPTIVNAVLRNLTTEGLINRRISDAIT